MGLDVFEKTIHSNAFLGRLPDDVFGTLLRAATRRTVPPGVILVDEGRPAKTFRHLIRGYAKLTCLGLDSSEVVIDVASAGMNFGDAPAAGDIPSLFTATTLTECDLLEVPRSILKDAIESDPQACLAALDASYGQFQRLVKQMNEIKSATGVQRLGRFILRASALADDPKTVVMPFEKQVLASLLGIKPETLSRGFKSLSEHGVSVHGARIRLTNRAALEEFVSR